ncbi:MAG: GAF domain-containing protein [Gemmatimonas sp.]
MTPHGTGSPPTAPALGLAGHLLGMATTTAEIVRTIRGAGRHKCDVDGVTFVVRDGDHCRYVDEDAVGPLWKGSSFPLTMCITGHAMLAAKTIVVPDIYRDPRIPHELYRPTFVKSLAAVPIGTPKAIACVGFYWGKVSAGNASCIAFLEALAAAAAAPLQACMAREAGA